MINNELNSHDSIGSKSVIILGDTFTFPEGNAATNRVHTFAKGFIENNLSTYVICFRNDYTEIIQGRFNEIGYYYPFGQKTRSKSFLIRRWIKVWKYYRTYVILKEISQKGEILAINLWTNTLVTQFFVFLLGKMFKTKIIHEHSEHPLREYKSTGLRKQLGELKSYLGTRMCDGIFCISDYLMKFYLARGVKKEKLMLVPSTVDTGRFIIAGPSPLPYDYILYCGSLTVQKDGVDILVESFSRVSLQFPEIKLVLIGKGDIPDEEIAIRNKVSQMNFADKVVFLGQLSRTEVPDYICHARILALARPRSIVADAGFPSKLTEYLSSGKPVVVTKVGEIPNFLKDNEHAFLVEPNSSEEFSNRLLYVLTNYELALTVGKNGKTLTDTVFNYSFQASRMLEFIKAINNQSNNAPSAV
jgi:glycosyltransferase involved in cell wall biosynthesis